MGERQDPSYLMQAAELYRLNVERLKIVQTVQADYGKWLIATLSLIHTGALYAIASDHLGSNIRNSFVPPLFGILLTLTSAFFAWVNFSLGVRLMESWTDPKMLSDDARWPKVEGALKFWIPATMALSVGTGIAAGACIIWTAIKLAP
jgi:hypothetical protein